MKTIAEAFISFFELAEAEGRLLKRKVVETSGVVILLVLGAVFVAIAVALVLTAIHHVFASWFSPPAAFFATAIVCLLIAGGIFWIAKELYNKE